MTARAKKAARSSTHGELAPCPGDVVRPYPGCLGELYRPRILEKYGKTESGCWLG